MYKYNEKSWNIAYKVILFRVLIDGMEFSIVMPSLWKYINTDFNAGIDWKGWILAAYQISNCLSTLIFGILRDKGTSGKTLMLVSCFSSMIGNFMYCLAPQVQYVLLGRVLGGLSVFAVHLAEVGKNSNLETGRKQAAIGHICMTFGFTQILGTLSLMILDWLNVDFNINIFGIDKHINPNNFGGVVLACFYATNFILVYFLYKPENFIQSDYEKKFGKIEAETEKLNPEAADKNAGENEKTEKTDENQHSLFTCLTDPVYVTTVVGIYFFCIILETMNVLLAPIGQYYFDWLPAREIAWLFTLYFLVRTPMFTVAIKFKAKHSIRKAITLGSFAILLVQVLYGVFYLTGIYQFFNHQVLELAGENQTNFVANITEADPTGFNTQVSELQTKTSCLPWIFAALVILDAFVNTFIESGLHDTVAILIPGQHQGQATAIKAIMGALGFITGDILSTNIISENIKDQMSQVFINFNQFGESGLMTDGYSLVTIYQLNVIFFMINSTLLCVFYKKWSDKALEARFK